MYRASRIRRHRRWEGVASGPFVLLFFAASFASIAEGGPIDIVKVRKSGNTYVASVIVSSVLGAGAVAGEPPPSCEPIVGALVLPMGATVNIDNVTQDGSPAVLDANYGGSFEWSLLAAALQNAQLFDPQTEDLFTFRFHPNSPCLRPYEVVVTFRFKPGEGGPDDLVDFTGGATNESDLEDGDLTNFKTVDVLIDVAGACCDTLNGVCSEVILADYCVGDQLVWTRDAMCDDVPCAAVSGACCDQDPFGACSQTSQAECACGQCVWHELLTCADIECSHNPIPTVSEWGLVVMALLLLTGAKVYFGRRSVTASP